MSPAPEDLAIAGRRVFVTGGTGFLGTHLIDALVAGGAIVHAIVRPSGTMARPLAPGVKWHESDLLDATALRQALEAAEPQCLFHFAAYGTTSAQTDPDRMFRVNIEGTRTLWTVLAALPAGRCRVVHTGTCAEYGHVAGAISEDGARRPRSWYPATVHAAVTISQARAAEAGRELVVLRPFGPYGAGDRPERLIPYVISQLVSGGRAAVSQGDQLRDYSHVDDHVRAMLLAALRPVTGWQAVYNIGSGRPIRVRDLIAAIAVGIGDDALDRIDFGASPPRPDDAPEMHADVTAARRYLGYTPRVELAEGLRRTIVAYRETVNP